MSVEVLIRNAGPADAETVAILHAASWRNALRGILRDAYLDGGLDADRRAVWRAQLQRPEPKRVTILAERDGVPVGFGCVLLDADPRWGSLVESLHAGPAERGRGIGRALMREMAVRTAASSPGRPLHLFCIEANRAAQGFYERLGGTVTGRETHDEPDGGRHPCLRYAWPSSEDLLAAVG